MKKALVIGLGMSGRAAAEFLLKHGYVVVGVEKNGELLKTHPAVHSLQKMGLITLPEPAQVELAEIDLVVPSPGVPQTHSLYRAALERGVEIIGEAELAFRHMQQKAVAITGTNGKTTVTLLVEHVLNAAGHKAKALGNVGEPLTTYFLNPDPEEIVVAELSSYQLETMKTPVFDAAVLLNITPDHLDRYPDMREYARAKCRLQACLKKGAPFYVYERAAEEFGELLTDNFSTYGVSITSHYWTDKLKAYRGDKVELILPLGYRELGSHESENVLAAWLLVRPFGVSAKQFTEAVESFRKPPHRIEFVSEISGVAFYDDSKGTNLDAVIRAVGTMQGPVILIAGGVDKGASYTPWIAAFQKRVKKIIALGQAAQKIQGELGRAFEVEIVETMRDAVCHAHSQAERGDSVLLSPGCSSFDMFRDYAHRGEEFKLCVNDLERSGK